MLFFGAKDDCEYCDDTLQLVSEMTELDDKLSLSVYDVEADREMAQRYRVDKTPGLVIAGRDGDQLDRLRHPLCGHPGGARV